MPPQEKKQTRKKKKKWRGNRGIIAGCGCLRLPHEAWLCIRHIRWSYRCKLVTFRQWVLVYQDVSPLLDSVKAFDLLSGPGYDDYAFSCRFYLPVILWFFYFILFLLHLRFCFWPQGIILFSRMLPIDCPVWVFHQVGTLFFSFYSQYHGVNIFHLIFFIFPLNDDVLMSSLGRVSSFGSIVGMRTFGRVPG